VGPRFIRPAEFARISTLPSVPSTVERRCSSEVRSLTSTAKERLRQPTASIAAGIVFTWASRRPVATTSAPACANPMAMARPMPDVPPTTTAVLPFRSKPRYATFPPPISSVFWWEASIASTFARFTMAEASNFGRMSQLNVPIIFRPRLFCSSSLEIKLQRNL
jgi:hypothetical protein